MSLHVPKKLQTLGLPQTGLLKLGNTRFFTHRSRSGATNRLLLLIMGVLLMLGVVSASYLFFNFHDPNSPNHVEIEIVEPFAQAIPENLETDALYLEVDVFYMFASRTLLIWAIEEAIEAGLPSEITEDMAAQTQTMILEYGTKGRAKLGSATMLKNFMEEVEVHTGQKSSQSGSIGRGFEYSSLQDATFDDWRKIYTLARTVGILDSETKMINRNHPQSACFHPHSDIATRFGSIVENFCEVFPSECAAQGYPMTLDPDPRDIAFEAPNLYPLAVEWAFAWVIEEANQQDLPQEVVARMEAEAEATIKEIPFHYVSKKLPSTLLAELIMEIEEHSGLKRPTGQVPNPPTATAKSDVSHGDQMRLMVTHFEHITPSMSMSVPPRCFSCPAALNCYERELQKALLYMCGIFPEKCAAQGYPEIMDTAFAWAIPDVPAEELEPMELPDPLVIKAEREAQMEVFRKRSRERSSASPSPTASAN
ncbi:hypothetical protein HN748_03710 [Candidatus Peregrinibacteria bacterium]|jgi:hypothetical protein|nr:hypothetical protein [Candidatus Peregrinibacteria bacterium]MBT7703315.1 hypothetical protein [Candidatus Peregrinibacteria bacterium]